MSIEKNILGVIPGLQATALVGENLKLTKGIGKKGKMKPSKLLKTGIKNIVGVGLISPTSKMINEIN